MQRFLSYAILGLAVGAVSACDKPALTIPTENIPTEGVRFINAVPDSSGGFGLDFRFVDIVESNVQFRINFRNSPTTTTSGVIGSASVQYKAARVTTAPRQWKIFLDDTLQARASTVVQSGSTTFIKDHNYSFILMGNARSTGADKLNLLVVDETAELAKAPINGDPGAAKVALRVLNTTSAAIGASAYPCTGSTAACAGTVPGTATWPTIAAFSYSPFVLVDSTFYKFNVTGTGGVFADLVALGRRPNRRWKFSTMKTRTC